MDHLPETTPQSRPSADSDLSLKCGPEKADLILSRLGLILSAYRKDEVADPDGWVKGAALLLEDYSEAVILNISNPKNGIQTQLKFFPTHAELKEACSTEDGRLVRIANLAGLRYRATPRPTVEYNLPGARANVFVPFDHSFYAEMYERTKSADPRDWKWDTERRGLWVTLPWLDRRIKGWVSFFDRRAA